MHIFFYVIYKTLSLQSPRTFVSRRPVYSICYGNEGASSSVSDVDRYVITRKLLDYIALNDILNLLLERGCVIVSDVGRYVITRKLVDYTALEDILSLLGERGCVIVSDVDRYVITRK
jgi:predicted transcriptional regulator